MAKKRTRMSAIDVRFRDYRFIIDNAVIKHHGTSYMTYEVFANAWRGVIPYSQQVKDFLILQTKLHIATIKPSDYHNEYETFLKPFVVKIANYLAQYTMREKHNTSVQVAENALITELWDKNQYIQNLLDAKKQRETLKAMSPEERHKFYVEKDKSNSKKYAQQQKKLRKEIYGMFNHNFR